MRPTDYLTLLAALANLGIGLFVISRNYKRTLYISFAAFSFITGLWVLSNFLFAAAPSKILLESQYSLGTVVIPVSLIWFLVFLEGTIKKRTVLLLISLSVVLFVIPFYNSLVIENFTILGHHQYSLILSGFFNLYSVIPLTFFAALLVKLIIGYRKSKGVKKAQLRYILAGVIGFGGVSLLVSFILPLFNISIVAPFDAQSSLIFVGFSLYAIIRHQLLDIRLVITRSLIYGILLTVVSFALIAVTIISSQFFGGSAASRNTVTVVVAALIIFGLDPFRNLLSRVTDRIFFKARVDYQEVLRQVSESLSFELDLRKIIISVRQTLVQELKLKSVVTLLRKTGGLGTEKFEALPDMLAVNPNLSIRNDSALIKFLREHRHPSMLESLERKIDDTPEDKRAPLIASRDEFQRMGAGLAAPIYAQGHLIAVLVLGPKLSGDTFSNEDLQLLEVLAPSIGSAIQKANLFEEVRQFGESLKIKVEEATAELQERNVSLETLQTITKDITHRLDFNQVVQNIADSVSTKLGYIGAILVFLDDDGRTVRARAITQTSLTQQAQRILPIRFDQYKTDLQDAKSNSLGHAVLRTGEIKTTENFADVVSPPLPRLLAQTIQKVVGIKSMVLIPIVSEGKTIGVIEIGTRKALKDISRSEIATMQAMADELGIVARNLQLFQQLRVTNDQLGVANEHLKELDQAKSEFVSIASHQLRTPMTGIMGYLSMMTQGDFGKIKPEHSKILVDLLGESQRMIRLINQFLNVSKIEAGRFTYTKSSVQINDLIGREIKELTKNATDKGLKLSYTPPTTPLPVVMADGDKLQDVILNLIDNAIKYSSKGGIVVRAETIDQAGGAGQAVHVMVKDTGIGIKHEDAPALFSKFVRGSGIAQIHPDGSGLGLFIAKSIVDSHGGRIWVESVGEGKGSTFQFTIPVVPPPGVDSHPFNASAHVVKPQDQVATQAKP